MWVFMDACERANVLARYFIVQVTLPFFCHRTFAYATASFELFIWNSFSSVVGRQVLSSCLQNRIHMPHGEIGNDTVGGEKKQLFQARHT